MAADKEHERKLTTLAKLAPVAERPPLRLFLIALGLCVWLAVPLVVILGTTMQGQLVFAVCLAFSLIAFAISGMTVIQALRSRPGRARGETSTNESCSAERQLVTHSGKLPMKAAAVQILLIPGSVAIGLTFIAIIDVIVRT